MLPHRYALPPYYRPPDRAAVQALQDAYASAQVEGYTVKLHPWPPATLTLLGRLYIKAWGDVPTPNRLQARWCMPEAKAVLRAFGSYAAYYAAIEKDDTHG
jgi:hypothetical protein